MPTDPVIPPPTEDDMAHSMVGMYHWVYRAPGFESRKECGCVQCTAIRRCHAAETKLNAAEQRVAQLTRANKEIVDDSMQTCDAFKAERDAALKRVKELEAHTLDCCGHRFGPEGP